MKPTIGIIGGGNMGTAIIKGLAGHYKIVICEKDRTKAASLRRRFRVSAGDLSSLVKQSDIVIFAVKPQDMEPVLLEIRPLIGSNQLFVSIAAGITTQFIERKLGPKARVIRTMPNMPAQIAEGITALCKGKRATAKDVKLVSRLLERVGQTVVVRENLLDAVTAVSGSGPAYVFLFVECLSQAAQNLGLDAALSQKLIRATVSGSVHLLNRASEDPGILRAKVTSKGGTTQAAMDVFAGHHLQRIFMEALTAAKKRAGELAR